MSMYLKYSFRMSRFFFIAALLPLSIFGQRRNFDEGWKFHLGNAADPHRDFNYSIGNILAKTGEAANTCIKMDFDDRDWSPVSLPHDWAVALPFGHVRNGDVDAHGYH